MFALYVFVFALIVTITAKKQGFYKLPTLTHIIPIRLSCCFVVVVLYATTFALFTAWFFAKISTLFPAMHTLQVFFHIVTGSAWLGAGCIMLYVRLFLPHGTLRLLFYSPRPLQTLTIGILAWFLIFPFVLLISDGASYLLHDVWHFPIYDQIAVRSMKMALHAPSSTIEMFSLIVVLGPLIEEFFFRGLVQNFCKRYLSRNKAILLSAFIFTLFHYSSEQHIDNLTLSLALFPLGCFLGFLYEREKSLLAPCALHVVFNLGTTLQLLWFS